jgi:hypothetical protein
MVLYFHNINPSQLQVVSSLKSYISDEKESAMSSILPLLDEAEAAFKERNIFSVVKKFDQLATFMTENPATFEPLISLMKKIPPENGLGGRLNNDIYYIEHYWKHYIVESIDNQISNPDNYPFQKVFIQAPFWICLLMTKLDILPPVIQEPANSMFHQHANTVGANVLSPAEKRRIQWGFLPILIPLFGIPDPVLRK